MDKKKFLKLLRLIDIKKNGMDGLTSYILALDEKIDELGQSQEQKDQDLLSELNEIKEIIQNVKLKKGPQGEKGDKGKSGKDGKNADKEKILAELIKKIPKPIKGEDGLDGLNGEDGKTPQKGIDYFTEEDKTELSLIALSQHPFTHAEQIVGAINNLPVKKELQIDAKHIKNLPEPIINHYGGSTVIQGGAEKVKWRVDYTDTNNTDVPYYSGQSGINGEGRARILKYIRNIGGSLVYQSYLTTQSNLVTDWSSRSTLIYT